MSDPTPDTLADLLLTEGAEEPIEVEAPARTTPPAATPPSEPAERPSRLNIAGNVGGIDGAIQSKQRELQRLEEQLLNARDEGSPYWHDDGQGGRGFDGIQYQNDTIRRSQLERELAQLERQRGQVTTAAERWAAHAEKRAVNFLRGNMAGVPEALRPQVKKSFVTDFQQLTANGYWGQPAAQSEAAIAEAVESLFDKAVGFAQRQARRSTTPAEPPERERGLPPQPPAEAPDDGFGDDELARQIFNNHVQQKDRRFMTLADIQKERMEEVRREREQASQE